MNLKLIPFYLIFLIITILFVSLFWLSFVNGYFYYCSDPVLVFDFIPPFVHGEGVGDYYIASPSTVYAIWYFCVAVIILLPLLITVAVHKEMKQLIVNK